ncbi:MAG: hypothetical protein V3R91_08490 [Myxococcota bacterium]
MPTIIRPEDRKLEPLGQDTTGRNADGDWIKHWVICEGSPYLHMTQVSPGFVIHPHSHSEPEVTLILSGTVALGDEQIGAGSLILIDADEEYSLVAGEDEPLLFVVFRPKKAAFQGTS